MRYPSIVPLVLAIVFLAPSPAAAVSREDGREGCAFPAPYKEYLSDQICARVREEAAVRFLPAALKHHPGSGVRNASPGGPGTNPVAMLAPADLVSLLPTVADTFDILGASLPALSDRFGAAWNGEAVSFRGSRRLIADLRTVVKRVRLGKGTRESRELAPDADDPGFPDQENGTCNTCDLRRILSSYLPARGGETTPDRSEAPVY